MRPGRHMLGRLVVAADQVNQLHEAGPGAWPCALATM
jgi:hypothetical protein